MTNAYHLVQSKHIKCSTLVKGTSVSIVNRIVLFVRITLHVQVVFRDITLSMLTATKLVPLGIMLELLIVLVSLVRWATVLIVQQHNASNVLAHTMVWSTPIQVKSLNVYLHVRIITLLILKLGCVNLVWTDAKYVRIAPHVNSANHRNPCSLMDPATAVSTNAHNLTTATVRRVVNHAKQTANNV